MSALKTRPRSKWKWSQLFCLSVLFIGLVMTLQFRDSLNLLRWPDHSLVQTGRNNDQASREHSVHMFSDMLHVTKLPIAQYAATPPALPKIEPSRDPLRPSTGPTVEKVAADEEEHEILSEAAGETAESTTAIPKGPLRKLFANREDRPWKIMESEFAEFWVHPVWRRYVEHHQRMMKGTEKPRFLVFKQAGGQGFGNLFAGVELCFYLAWATGRTIIVEWSAPVNIENVFDIGDVDWRLSKHVASLRKLDQKSLTMLNFGGPTVKVKEVVELANSDLGALLITSNLGVGAFEKKLFFGRYQYPDLNVNKLIKPWVKLKGFAFHSLFKMPKKGSFAALWRDTDNLVPPGPRIGIHLRAGDISWSKGNSDRRPVLFAPKWGLKTPSEAARQSVECAQQLAQQVGFAAPCAIVFESDNAEAKRAVRDAVKQSGPCTAWASRSSPKHSSGAGNKEGMETWLALVMLSSVELVMLTTGTFGNTAGFVGPGVTTLARLPKFEDFLIKRAKLKLPRDDTTDLCSFSRQPKNPPSRRLDRIVR